MHDYHMLLISSWILWCSHSICLWLLILLIFWCSLTICRPKNFQKWFYILMATIYSFYFFSFSFFTGTYVPWTVHHVWLCPLWHSAHHWESREWRQGLCLVSSCIYFQKCSSKSFICWPKYCNSQVSGKWMTHYGWATCFFFSCWRHCVDLFLDFITIFRKLMIILAMDDKVQ